MLSEVQPIIVQQAWAQTNTIVNPAPTQMAQLIRDNQNLFAEDAARSQQEYIILNARQNKRSKFNSLLQHLTQTNKIKFKKFENHHFKRRSSRPWSPKFNSQSKKIQKTDEVDNIYRLSRKKIVSKPRTSVNNQEKPHSCKLSFLIIIIIN